MINKLMAILLRIVFAVSGLVIFFVVMVFGAVLAIGVTVWALLTGRRIQPLKFRWQGPGDWRSATRGASQRPRAAPPADVVDVEVREIESVSRSSERTPDR